MRKLIVWNLMTLDGYFEGKEPWSLDFHGLAWGEELQRFATDQLNEGDLLVFGRKTFEGMASYWQTAENELEIKAHMNSIAKIGASRTIVDGDWNNSRIVADIVPEIERLKQQDGKTMFIFGSADLTDSLLKAGLIDEIRICLVPVLLGAGNPLFKSAESQMRLTLIDSTPLSNGAIILRYAPTAA
jgi:dihydrofolate reductase